MHCIKFIYETIKRATIAQSVQRLARGCTVRESNPGGNDSFRTCHDRLWEPTSLLQVGTGSFPGVKRAERRVDHPPPTSAEVKERVDLYLYPTSDHGFL